MIGLQVSWYFNVLLAGLLVDFIDLIILERSKHSMNAIFQVLMGQYSTMRLIHILLLPRINNLYVQESILLSNAPLEIRSVKL